MTTAYPKKQKSSLLNGIEPLSYQGVQPTSPADYVTDVRDPISGTTQDYAGFNVGDEWENRNTHAVWKLVSKDNGVATWVLMIGANGNVTNLIDDAGDIVTPNATGGITVQGGELINTTNPAPHVIAVNLDRGLNGQVPIAATGGATIYANLIEGANIGIANGPNSITISAAAGPGGDITLVSDTGNTATTVAGSVNVFGTAGHIVTDGDNVNTFTIDIGGDIAATYTTDAGNAVPVASVLNVLGGLDINTAGAGNTVTVNLDNPYQAPVGATNEIMIVDNNGIIGSQAKVLFSAVMNNENNASGDSTAHQIGSITAMTEFLDTHAAFFPGNGAGLGATFTAPVAGYYLLTLNVSSNINNATGGLEQSWYLQKNGVNDFASTSLPTRRRCNGFYSTNGFITTTGSVIIGLNIGDIITFIFQSFGGAKTDGVSEGQVQGYLLCYL
jgi:hypothetical protein